MKIDFEKIQLKINILNNIIRLLLFIKSFIQDVISILGVSIGALKIPEKWCPGSLDMCFNSHNIMHFIVVLAVYPMHQSTVKDLIWMTHDQCKSGNLPSGV